MPVALRPTCPHINLPTPQDEASASDLLVLHEAAKLIGRVGVPELAVNGLLRLTSQMLGLNRGRVLLPTSNLDKLRIHYSYGLTSDERERGTYDLGEGISGRVMTTGQTAVVQDIDDEPLYLCRAVDRETLPNDVVAYIAVPIIDGDTPVGVLAVHRLRKRQRPIKADLTILQIIATFIAQILKINTLIEERTANLLEENRELKGALDTQSNSPGVSYGILGESLALKFALRQALQVANTAVTVLLTGESGTGKEKFSRVLHLNSNRKDESFLAINCAAIPEQLLESELFGHEKGAFTGASHLKIGKLELASGGTLFLDEIGDLSLELQSKLLRVLEKQIIQRVGGVKDIPVDVRIVAATHNDLQTAVNEGRFRLDLFYRLSVFPLKLPPLRERQGDIRILARYFLQDANQEYMRDSHFTSGVMERLESYNWPGNIRQLENVIKRAVLLSQGTEIKPSEIELILQHESNIATHLESGQTSGFSSPSQATMPRAIPAEANSGLRPYAWVSEDEKESLLDALKQAGGNKTRAALLLGMTPRQFRYRLQKLGITLQKRA